jgi:hypothetical protein
MTDKKLANAREFEEEERKLIIPATITIWSRSHHIYYTSKIIIIIIIWKELNPQIFAPRALMEAYHDSQWKKKEIYIISI